MMCNRAWLVATLRSFVDAGAMTEYVRSNILDIDATLRKENDELRERVRELECGRDSYWKRKDDAAIKKEPCECVDGRIIKPHVVYSKGDSYEYKRTEAIDCGPCSECNQGKE